MFVVAGRRINTLGGRRKLADPPRAKLVCQTEFAMTSARGRRYVKTVGYGDCLVLSLTSPRQRVGGLAHFDVRTMVEHSFDKVILPECQRRGLENLEGRPIGGLPTRASESLIRSVRDICRARGIKITGMDLFGRDRGPGIILDTQTASLYDRREPLPPENAETLERHEAALRYLMKRPTQRMIRLVENS